MVCSKTEAQQADYMFYHGYDYLYEKRLDLIDNGRPTWRYPDFTILDPVTREEVVFEHFGMVDDEGYQHSMFDKIRLYEENGYVIGQNFLFTFETAEHPVALAQLSKEKYEEISMLNRDRGAFSMEKWFSPRRGNRT